MKTKIYLSAFVCLIIISCTQQENTVSPSDAVTSDRGNSFQKTTLPTVSAVKTGGLTVDFNYSLKTDPSCTNCWHCPTPKSDCSKVSKSATARGVWSQFEEAVANGTVNDFFNASNKWNSIFPNFREQKEWLLMLQSGKVTLVKLTTNEKNNEDIYAAVSKSDGGTKQDIESNAVFAIAVQKN